jgi:hypothetical protein
LEVVAPALSLLKPARLRIKRDPLTPRKEAPEDQHPDMTLTARTIVQLMYTSCSREEVVVRLKHAVFRHLFKFRAAPMTLERSLSGRTLFFFVLAIALPSIAESSTLRVFSDNQQNIHIVSPTGQESIVKRESGQVGIDAIKIAADKLTAGWLVLYRNPDAGSPVAAKIVVWRNGKIIRSFPTEQTFWSWSFEHGGEQVAYHTGPAHGDTTSHCELHDVQAGRLLATWDGDLQSAARPAWTKNLDH